MNWAMHVVISAVGSGGTNVLLSSGTVGIDTTGNNQLTSFSARNSGTFDTTAALTIGPCIRFADISAAPHATAAKYRRL